MSVSTVVGDQGRLGPPRATGAPRGDPRAWLVPFGWLLVVVVAYPFLPRDLQVAVYLLTSAGTVAAALTGLHLWKPRPRAPWLLMVAAYTCTVVADLLSQRILLDADAPGAAVSDVAYLAFYPFVLIALVLLLRGRDPDGFAWVDAAIWTVGASLLVWEFQIEPLASQPITLHTATAMAYPLMDLLVLVVVVRVVVTSRSTDTALRLLGLAMVVLLVSDLLYIGTAYAPGGWVDVGWLTSYVLVAAAVLHPSVGVPFEPLSTRDDVRLTWRRILILVIPGLVGPLTMLSLVVTGAVATERDDTVVAAVVSVANILLAAIRGIGLVNLANRRADDLQKRVDRDSLTGLSSRDAFVEALGESLRLTHDADPGVEREPSAVLFMDLDDFKDVNDTQGHQAGDHLLVEVARRLRSACPAGCAVARFGGDEFAMLVPAGRVEVLARRALAAVGEPVLVGHRVLRIRASIGSAVARPGDHPEELLRRVDVAMYAAKRGPNPYVAYRPEMSDLVHARFDREEQLKRALTGGEVVAWFQPVVDLVSGRLRGFEALARWMPPGGAVVPAHEWVPLAEESALIVEVDRVVLAAALAQLAVWRAVPGGEELHLAVNLSGRTLAVPGIDEEVLHAARAAGVPGEALVVEVTEGVLIEDDEVSRRLQRLRTNGIRVALDDFGTGWSSLSYLQRFPVDQLKLDRSFTALVARGRADAAIPSVVAQLAATLGLELVAEGVETVEQQAHLVRLGFVLGQGFLFAAARPASRLEHMLGGLVVEAAS